MNGKNSIFGVGFVFIFVLVASLTLGFVSPAKAEIVIAVAGPMTGSGAQYGKLFKLGAEASATVINQNGGINGEKIVIRTYDDKNNPTEAANVAQKISTQKEVVSVIGHFTSSATYAAIPIYQRNGIPLIVVTATDPALTKQGNTFVFRICITQEVDGSAVAKWVVKKLNKKRIAGIYINTDYGKAHFANFKKTAEALGGKIVVEERYQPGTVDFSSILIKVKNANVDVIELGTYYNDVALIAKQARKLGIKVTIAASGAARAPALIKIGGKAVEGLYITQLTAGPKIGEAFKTFKKLYNMDRVPAPQFTFATYDAVRFIAEAIKRGGSTERDSIRNTLATFKDFPTTSIYATFDKDRQVNFPSMDIVQVQDGKFVKVGSSE